MQNISVVTQPVQIENSSSAYLVWLISVVFNFHNGEEKSPQNNMGKLKSH